MERTVLAGAVEQLTPQFDGLLLQPGDEGYDEARMVWNGLFDRRPALIAQCQSVEDVVAAVNFAREAGLEVAVRGGGHSVAGHGTVDDGLVIDLRGMNSIVVDPEARTARAGAGATWGEFDAATQEYGLAVTGGRFSTTGIAGLTLGSGSGWIERRCGLTADNLLSVELVTADGRALRASKDENPELFWGVRGGSGNFGVITSFEYRLHPIGPIILGGMLIALPDRAEATLKFMSDYMRDAPDDLGAGIAFLSAPPEPFVPPEMHFKPIVAMIVCWTGDHEEGERVIAPIKEAMQPVMDMVGPMPYTALQSMLDASGPFGIRGYFKAEFMADLSDEAIETLIEYGASRPGPLVQLLLEPMGGAISRLDEDESALGRRQVRWCYHALTMWMEPDQETADRHIAWARQLAEDLEPATTAGVYLNYTSDAGEDRVRSAYGPEKYARLVALKDEHDPDNLFHLNQNIRPSNGAGG